MDGVFVDSCWMDVYRISVCEHWGKGQGRLVGKVPTRPILAPRFWMYGAPFFVADRSFHPQMLRGCNLPAAVAFVACCVFSMSLVMWSTLLGEVTIGRWMRWASHEARDMLTGDCFLHFRVVPTSGRHGVIPFACSPMGGSVSNEVLAYRLGVCSVS